MALDVQARWRRALSVTAVVVLVAMSRSGRVESSGQSRVTPLQETAALSVRIRADVEAGYDMSCRGPFLDIGTEEITGHGEDRLSVEYQGNKRFPLKRLTEAVDIRPNDPVDSHVSAAVSGGGSLFLGYRYTSGIGKGSTVKNATANWTYGRAEGELSAPTFSYTDDRTVTFDLGITPLPAYSAHSARESEVAPKGTWIDLDATSRYGGGATALLERALAAAEADSSFRNRASATLPTSGPISLSGSASFTFHETIGADAFGKHGNSAASDGWAFVGGTGCKNAPRGSASHTVNIRMDWTLGAAPPPAEVILTPPSGLARWRPTAASVGVPGSTLVFAGRVQGIDRKPVRSDTPVTVEFELLTSQLPGDCNNHPHGVDAHTLDPDLDIVRRGTSPELTVTSREPVEVGDYRYRVRLKGAFKVGDRFNLAVGSFDYGAFGELRVSSSVPVRVEGQPGTTVMLPKDDNRNHVADSWEEKNVSPGTSSAAAADLDGDFQPGYEGDGLSLYEEYRGFYVDGRWLSTRPFERDLFVYSERRSKTDSGADLFSAATSVRIHKVRADEIDAAQVVNFNSTFAHGVDQRAVRIRVASDGELQREYRQLCPNCPLNTVGGFALPDQREILVPFTITGSGVAHELGHIVSMDHHGDGDYDLTLCAPGSESDPTCQKKAASRSKLESEARRRRLKPDDVFIAVQQGEHSGWDPCIMRYTSADFIEQADGSFVGYGAGEPEGRTFCDYSAGHGVNAGPHAKTGKATAGECIKQLRVREVGR